MNLLYHRFNFINILRIILIIYKNKNLILPLFLYYFTLLLLQYYWDFINIKTDHFSHLIFN